MTAQPNLSDSVSLAEVPFVTADCAPLGGTIKARPEDFLVEEVPLYDPCGEGEHIYLMVEKRGLSTSQMVDVVAKHFGVRPRDIGYAGMKDRRAVTRQVVSVHVPGKSTEDFPSLRHDKISILWADQHTNKLRLGHLKGNRFSIKIRGVPPTAVLTAEKVLRKLEVVGVPNFFGEQRFGYRLNNHRLGRLVFLDKPKDLLDELLGPDEANPEFNAQARALYVKGDYENAMKAFPHAQRPERDACRLLLKGVPPEKVARKIDPVQLRFWISAWQSALFNRVLAWRIREGLLDTLIEGDLAFRHIGGAVFRITPEELAKDELPGRISSLEISPSGPIWGARMTQAEGREGVAEAEALESSGVTFEHIERCHKGTGAASGARRPLRVPVRDALAEGGADEHGEYVRCAFELPSGSYATLVMREIMKTSGLDEEGDGARE